MHLYLCVLELDDPKAISRLVAAQFLYFRVGSWRSLVLPLTGYIEEGLANFFWVKGQLINILEIALHMVSVAVIQFCSCSMQASIICKQMSVTVF